jgi:hypothetical protein
VVKNDKGRASILSLTLLIFIFKVLTLVNEKDRIQPENFHQLWEAAAK